MVKKVIAKFTSQIRSVGNGAMASIPVKYLKSEYEADITILEKEDIEEGEI